MSEKKNLIFFSHSFDDKSPNWSDKSDKEIANWFENELKRKWRVISGTPNQAQPIGDKVIDAIDESVATFALFTRKNKIESAQEKYTTSPWVLCECSYALGRFKHSKYIVGGFREKGVDVSSLGMLTIGGMEIPEFDRNQLEDSRRRLQQYLGDLENRITQGDPGQRSFTDSYCQTALNKIFIVYRNGFGTIQNIVTCVIRDADAFYQVNKGKIEHRIWSHYESLPTLAEMMDVSVDRRKNQAFFNARLDYQPHKNIQAHLRINESVRDGNGMNFTVEFVDERGQPFKLKNNDTIEYQYAWGMPNMYKIREDDLEEPDNEQVDATSYNLAEVEANHGKINNLSIELRFERGANFKENIELFSKSPFYRKSHGYSGGKWSNAHPIPYKLDYPNEYKMWYEVYKLGFKNFDEKVQVAWRPKRR